MSATLITPGALVQIKKVYQPAELQTIGSAPLNVFDKGRFLPLYISLVLSSGTTPYNFGLGNDFVFVSDVGGQIFFSNFYPLETIQNDETVICTPNQANGFKISSLGDISSTYSLQLTTTTGVDATQGDGILTLNFFGLVAL